MFRFDYKKPEDLEPKKVDLMPGEVSFKVSAVFDKKKDGTPLATMNGDPKLTLSLSCIDAGGAQAIVYDDLTSKTAWKIKTLLDAIGLPQLYDESGTLNPDDIVGCTGRCVIELKKSDGYPDRMQVKKYLKAKSNLLTTQTVKKDYSDELVDDEIPF